MTITPDTSVADGNYSLHVAGGTATDLSGNTQSAAFDYDFFLLSADANHDRRVHALDFNALASNFGKPNPTFSKGDFNFDNKVDTSDFIALATKFGTFLAPPAAPPAAPFATASIAAGSATLFHHNERLVADPIVLLA